MIEKTLKDLGLSEKEITVYLALLPLGSAAASTLGKRTQLVRSTARYTCQQLVKKGLFATAKRGNTFIFMPEPPDKIFDLLEREKQHILRKEEKVSQIVNQIKSMINPDNKVVPKVKFYEGIEGIKRAYEDSLTKNKTIYAFQNSELMPPEIKEYLKYYITKRIEKDIFAKVIVPNTEIHREILKTDNERYRKTRVFDQEVFPVEIEINIYGDKAVFISYKKEEMFAVILESPAIANTMKAIFHLCWKVAK